MSSGLGVVFKRQVCGWFLAVRVFALAITDSWTWVPWAMGGAMFCLLAFFLFRSKR